MEEENLSHIAISHISLLAITLNFGMALGMAWRFYSSVTKGLEPKFSERPGS